MSLQHNIFIQENVEFVNEAFVGKTPTLVEMEKKIGEIRPKIKYTGANNTLKETLELNRLFEKQFGMDTFALKVYPSEVPNAYTMVLGRNFDIAKYENLPDMIVADPKNGYRFKPDNGFCIIMNISSAIMTNPDFTDAEILAILLHELGHNFADCIYNDIYIYNKEMMVNYEKYAIALAIFYAITIIGIPAALMYIKPLLTMRNSTKRKSEKKNQKIGKGKLGALINGVKQKATDFGSLIEGIFYRLTGITTGYIRAYKRALEINGSKEQAKKSINRQNEVIADKFAGIYGYGPDLATGLLKLEAYSSKVEKIVDKFGEYGKNINDKISELLLDITDYDEHPQVIQRIMEEIKLLENELKKEDLDPKVKEIIQAQLNDLREIIKNATTAKEEMSKREKTKILYNQYIANECPDAIEKEIEDKIEEALDKVLNGGN